MIPCTRFISDHEICDGSAATETSSDKSKEAKRQALAEQNHFLNDLNYFAIKESIAIMSGDIQTRQRRKEKRKQKRDSIDQHALPKKFSLSEDEPAIGVDTTKIKESEKKDVQMHIHDQHDHGVGWCAKIVFFSLMAILAGLVVLIVLENRGQSDVDTPLSESRFSEYLQGWVDETREEEHHDEVHFTPPDDDEHDDDGHETTSLDEPYPEEKDYSTPEENNESEELNAEINADESTQDEQSDNQEDDDDDDETVEANETPSNNDDEDEVETRGDQQPEEVDDKEDEVPNMFEDSTPFEESELKITGNKLESQVDELFDTFNDIAKILGKETVNSKPTENMSNDDILDAAIIGKEDNDDDFEDVIDNDVGEDLLLQKLAEQSEAAAAQADENQEETDEAEAEGSSSLGVKIGVGVLLAIVAHQIIIKKISATNRTEIMPEVEIMSKEELLSKRRLTMLTGSEERLINDELDDEEIVEVMMVSGAHLNDDDDEEEAYTDSEDIGEEEEEEDYSDGRDSKKPFVPRTFEDFQTLFKHQFEPTLEEEGIQEPTSDSSEPQPVDDEMEKRVEEALMQKPFKKVIETKIQEPESSPDEAPYSQEDDYDADEPEEFSGEEILEEEEEDEENDYEDEMESDEDMSDIDDTDLMKRLEAKYGKISGENSEDEEDPEAWTKIPKEGGEKSYLDQLLEDQVRMDNSEEIEEMLLEAKITDARAEKEQSNKRLMEAIELYKDLLITHGDKLNASIFKEVAERCIERMRFIGKFKAAVKIHRLLIERFSDEPNYPNQLAVTYLLGNHLSEAKLILHEILMRWRFNGFALVHYGFVLKNLDKDYENAALYIKEGIDSNEPGTQDGRFYFNLGDALQRLGKNDEAREVYKKGAKIGLFLSEHQRSLYNVDHLKSTPFWTKVQTTYKDDLMEIQKYWQLIRDEGLKLLSEDGRFSNEAENLKDTGDWKQFELFARGRKTKHCMLAPITCQIIENFDAAATCKRGQVKFSVLHPKTHIHSHTGPTNCRVRCHLGLKVPEKTFLRVADETRSWKDGEWLIFDDSFEHEVWHNGTGLRLVLIVDVWHPQLTDLEKQSMSPI